jgi:hypothetical protein
MSIDRATFVRVASACNLSAAFSDTLSSGKGRTATGKVDCRKFAALMEKVAFMYGKDCASKYFMLPLLCAKGGIPMNDILNDAGEVVQQGFRWRGNATEGIESHPAAEVFQTLCTEYLQGLYPYETWETASSAPQVRRKDIPSDILATLDI